MQPLVLTLLLDAETTARFDAERRELFPSGRTAVGAHLTLFHAVPGDQVDRVLRDVAAAARRPAFATEVTEVVALGRGAAYRLRASELDDVHQELQRAWWPHLTRQDRQGLRAHVTVQNKAEKDVARRTLAGLRSAFEPFVARAEGIAVWRYVGGPWEPVERFGFA